MMLDVVVCVIFVAFGVAAVVLGIVNGGIWFLLAGFGVLLVVLGLFGTVLALRGRMNDRNMRTGR